MQTRWAQAVPQMMQRHTGTPWQQGDAPRQQKLAVKEKLAVREARHTEKHDVKSSS